MSNEQTLDEVLTERGRQNGDYGLQSEVEQAIKEAVYSTGRKDLTPYMKSSIDQIAHKLARIATGDLLHEDHWRDIAGYAELARSRIAKRNATIPPMTPMAPSATSPLD